MRSFSLGYQLRLTRMGGSSTRQSLWRDRLMRMSLSPDQPLAYFTAPKVRPRTNCFCVSQPSTIIGATARKNADSLVQKSPSVDSNRKQMNMVNSCALAFERLILQNASFQEKMRRRRAVEASRIVTAARPLR
jgi:hypothetical protein